VNVSQKRSWTKRRKIFLSVAIEINSIWNVRFEVIVL
jgi:hypothetical protein